MHHILLISTFAVAAKPYGIDYLITQNSRGVGQEHIEVSGEPKALVVRGITSIPQPGMRFQTESVYDDKGLKKYELTGQMANSDARIKQDIQPVGDALKVLSRVRLVSFRYTDDYQRSHPSLENRRYLNVVAQEFREVFPDHVKSSGETLPDGSEILQVDTYPLTIYSAAAIQELNGQVKQLQGEMKRRDAENEALRQRLEKLERLLARNTE